MAYIPGIKPVSLLDVKHLLTWGGWGAQLNIYMQQSSESIIESLRVNRLG